MGKIKRKIFIFPQYFYIRRYKEKIMIDNNTLISVRNRNNGSTGYTLPDRNLWRSFAPGETKKIPFEELQQLQYQPGGDYTLKNLLVVEDKEALEALNMAVQLEYNYTENDIRNLLLNGTIDQLKDFLDFAPDGAIELCKDIAVKEEIPDIRKRDAITEATGLNINNAINVNHIMNEGDRKEEPKKRERRVKAEAPASAEGAKQRRATPFKAEVETSTATPSTPNYKVVTKK